MNKIATFYGLPHKALIVAVSAALSTFALSAATASPKAPPGAGVRVTPAAPVSTLAEIRAQLLSKATASVRLTDDKATGALSMISVPRGGDLLAGAPSRMSPSAKAGMFLDQYGALFGISDASRQLEIKRLVSDQYGFEHVEYLQRHAGVPVFAGELKAHIAPDGKLTAVNGKIIQGIAVNTTPAVAKKVAQTRATRVVAAMTPKLHSAPLTVRSTTLYIYRTNLTKGIPGVNHLAWEVEVGNGSTVREFVYVDAHTGKIIDQVTGIHTLKERHVYEANFNPDDPSTPPPAWSEGDLRPAISASHEEEVAGAGESYNFFYNLSGGSYLSWDGADAPMYTVNNDPSIICPNANWNGDSTNYCTGTSADDVVAHEWGHAYTQETSGLIYSFQSGALNESYSDIWGETVDLLNNREFIAGASANPTGNTDKRSEVDGSCSDFDSQGIEDDLSYKWLIGEDAFLFSALPPVGDSAIRDMWNPACFGDPGHTQDGSNYTCTSGDAGGVHTNSAVPNRAYAILVDGDTIELRDDGAPFATPVTVAGIGLTKAAHIFWRANSIYNGRATNFNDNADALEQSCQDLKGINLRALVSPNEDGTSTVPGHAGENDDTIVPALALSGEIITQTDCEQVTAAIAAVEMRESVHEKCEYTVMLDPAPPPLCGTETKTTFFAEDWETGMDGWSTGQTPVSKPVLDTAEWFLRSTNLPDNVDGSPHTGTLIFQENRRDLGNCSTDDESGALWLETPQLTAPSPDPGHLVFEHFVQTEFSFDGGNVLLSVNGGAFSVIPDGAFEWNPYPSTLSSALNQNTNPKAGEQAYHGGNGGEALGSWGKSQIDLGVAGVTPGDTFHVRFEMGQDGCNGNDGWYIDDLEFFTCGDPDEPAFCTTGNGVINANNSQIMAGVPSISMANIGGAPTLEDINFTIEGTHTFLGDVTMILTSPAATAVTLFDGSPAGNNCGAEDWASTVTLDDEAVTAIACTDWQFGGVFQPLDPLSAYDGEDPNGNWTLTINDAVPLDDGTVAKWSIELCVTPPDTDLDGVTDDIDNCPAVPNTDQDDVDADGVGNACDNCSEEPNPDQCNTNAGTGPDQDQFGNACDADLNNDNIVNSFDLSILRQNFGNSGANDADLNCDNIVNSFDLSILRQNFGGAPGPTGIATP